uniref:Uncharacterized protein n=1 Tax=Siphoviridae sp. ctpLW14 TaxID=2826464 RepID=A0A8S5N9Q1_9CAUD|nr:MAG TPA: hypothetical protein [Siphoviridae sp. ctpLW14]
MHINLSGVGRHIGRLLYETEIATGKSIDHAEMGRASTRCARVNTRYRLPVLFPLW